MTDQSAIPKPNYGLDHSQGFAAECGLQGERVGRRPHFVLDLIRLHIEVLKVFQSPRDICELVDFFGERLAVASISDGFVILTDEIWDGTSLIIDQLSGNVYNVDGNATGPTTNVAEITTGTFEDTNNDGNLSDSSDSNPQEVYSANAGSSLAATSDFLRYTLEVQSTVALMDGTVLTGITLDIMVLENNQILFDFGDDVLAVNFNGASPIASIEVTGTTQNTYDWISIGAHDAAYAPVCFASNTLIQTVTGPIQVERIKAGDLVLTLANGFQPVRWVGSSRFDSNTLRTSRKFRPVVFAPGSLGPGLPERPLRVSRQHRMLVSSEVSKRMFGSEAVLIAAAKLVGLPGVTIEDNVGMVDYLHLLFDRHEVVFANGVPSESLYLGEQAWRSLSKRFCEEILSVCQSRINPETKYISNYAMPKPRLQKRFVERHKKNGKPIVAHKVIQTTGMENSASAKKGDLFLSQRIWSEEYVC